MDMPDVGYTSNEMMIVSASRYLKDEAVVFIGIGLPSLAANLAKRMHAPNISMIYESGTLDTNPDRPPLSIGDDELSRKALSVVSVPEMFRYWLQGGKIEIGFLGAAQIDRFGNLNSTVIGDYAHPKVRLPGAGGAPEIAGFCSQTIIVIRQTKRTFVEKLDFITSVGFGDGKSDTGFPGRGPLAVITDLGILEPAKNTNELTLTHLHPGVSIEEARDATGWSLQTITPMKTTQPPSDEELGVLRKLENSIK